MEYGKIIRGSTEEYCNVYEFPQYVDIKFADSQPEGYLPITKIGTKPAIPAGKWLAFHYTNTGTALKKEYFLVDEGQSAHRCPLGQEDYKLLADDDIVNRTAALDSSAYPITYTYQGDSSINLYSENVTFEYRLPANSSDSPIWVAKSSAGVEFAYYTEDGFFSSAGTDVSNLLLNGVDPQSQILGVTAAIYPEDRSVSTAHLPQDVSGQWWNIGSEIKTALPGYNTVFYDSSYGAWYLTDNDTGSYQLEDTNGSGSSATQVYLPFGMGVYVSIEVVSGDENGYQGYITSVDDTTLQPGYAYDNNTGNMEQLQYMASTSRVQIGDPVYLYPRWDDSSGNYDYSMWTVSGYDAMNLGPYSDGYYGDTSFGFGYYSAYYYGTIDISSGSQIIEGVPYGTQFYGLCSRESATSAGSSAVVTIPGVTEEGKVRDLLLRVITGENSVTPSFSEIDGDGNSISWISEDGEVPAVETGENLYAFTEMEPCKFLVSKKMLEAVD